MEKIKNWKLKEVLDQIEIIDQNSPDYIEKVLNKLKIETSDFDSVDRKETQIKWKNQPSHYMFYFDYEGNEQEIINALSVSQLGEKSNVIITYGWKEPVIKISTSKFISDWEDFLSSAKYETFIFSDDFELIIEVTRDYNMHSNFKIK